MITQPHLSTTLLYDVSKMWSMHLNICVSASSLEDVGVPGEMGTLSIYPILLDLDSGRYMEPLLPDTMSELVSRICGDGDEDSGGGSGGKIGGAGWIDSGAGTGGD